MFYDDLESDYELNIYINDRPYMIADLGRGECTIFLVDSTNTSDHRSLVAGEIERAIIVDASLAWQNCVAMLSADELFDLVSDIHLLVDIYWLESFKIKDLCSGGKIFTPLKNKINQKRFNESLDECLT
ncbi:hypothetical protein [Thaumasiovibrio subtropicus]|uniref:hypothetical protein n=1 Tax=Thaumasiovibrio subtropicus TaxID=1891207 RepID=UPI000B35271D|nr:hypothetical protein [Thaumasiovibrio subtropicus]